VNYKVRERLMKEKNKKNAMTNEERRRCILILLSRALLWEDVFGVVRNQD